MGTIYNLREGFGRQKNMRKTFENPWYRSHIKDGRGDPSSNSTPHTAIYRNGRLLEVKPPFKISIEKLHIFEITFQPQI